VISSERPRSSQPDGHDNRESGDRVVICPEIPLISQMPRGSIFIEMYNDLLWSELCDMGVDSACPKMARPARGADMGDRVNIPVKSSIQYQCVEILEET